MTRTIKIILEEMKQAVATKRPVSPTEWIDWSLELNALWQDLKSELDKAEIEYIRQVADIMETDDKMSKSKAEILAKAYRSETGEATPYEFYRYLKGRDKIIESYIMLAKKRATLEV